MTNSHRACSHPATKIARATCRKAKAALPTKPYIDLCDDCGAQHEAMYSHEGRFNEGAILKMHDA